MSAAGGDGGRPGLDVAPAPGDGTKSTREPDCAPYPPGAANERRYSVEHVFRRAGNYEITVALRHSGKSSKKGSAWLDVRSGASDPTEVRDF